MVGVKLGKTGDYDYRGSVRLSSILHAYFCTNFSLFFFQCKCIVHKMETTYPRRICSSFWITWENIYLYRSYLMHFAQKVAVWWSGKKWIKMDGMFTTKRCNNSQSTNFVLNYYFTLKLLHYARANGIMNSFNKA